MYKIPNFVGKTTAALAAVRSVRIFIQWRILSWNFNGIRAGEKKGFVEWLATEAPEVLAAGDKANPGQLSQDLLEIKDKSGKPYSLLGKCQASRLFRCGIYTCETPLDVRTMGIPDFDVEGRVSSRLPGVQPHFGLLSNSRRRSPARLQIALLRRDAGDLPVPSVQGRRIVLCGDLQHRHTPIDLTHPKANEENPAICPRSGPDGQIPGAGFVDTFRRFHPGEGGHYSWWSYRMRAEKRTSDGESTTIAWIKPLRIGRQCLDTAGNHRLRPLSCRDRTVYLRLPIMKIKYNAPTTLTFALICAIVSFSLNAASISDDIAFMVSGKGASPSRSLELAAAVHPRARHAD
jgi:exodeoxyribonuclease-3